jgi:hypothetical protein
MGDENPRLFLDKPAVYRIKVPGSLDEGHSGWVGGMTVTTEYDEVDLPATTLTAAFDQAALLGFLRQLYSLGLPLISVVCIEDQQTLKT